MILYKETSTIDDFVRAEVEEHGWEYVDALFDSGYEPMAPNGFWVWVPPKASNELNSSTIQSAVSYTIPQFGHKSPERVIKRN